MEAWAHYFALEVMNTPEKYNTKNDNTFYGASFEMVKYKVGSGNWYDLSSDIADKNELSVASVLWDLVDNTPTQVETHDNVNLSFKLLDMIMADKQESVYDFYTSLFQETTIKAMSEDVWKVFDKRDVSYDVNAPIVSITCHFDTVALQSYQPKDLEFSGSAIEDVKIVKSEWYINGTLKQSYSNTINPLVIDSNDYQNGMLYVELRVYDLEGIDTRSSIRPDSDGTKTKSFWVNNETSGNTAGNHLDPVNPRDLMSNTPLVPRDIDLEFSFNSLDSPSEGIEYTNTFDFSESSDEMEIYSSIDKISNKKYINEFHLNEQGPMHLYMINDTQIKSIKLYSPNGKKVLNVNEFIMGSPLEFDGYPGSWKIEVKFNKPNNKEYINLQYFVSLIPSDTSSLVHVDNDNSVLVIDGSISSTQEIIIDVNGMNNKYKKSNVLGQNKKLMINDQLPLYEGLNKIKITKKNKDKTLSEELFDVLIDTIAPNLVIQNVIIDRNRNGERIAKIYFTINEEAIITYKSIENEVSPRKYSQVISCKLDDLQSSIELKVTDLKGNTVGEEIDIE